MTQEKLKPYEFQLWSKYIHELSGIILEEEKSYLVQERIGSLLEEAHCTTFSQLYFHAKMFENQGLRNRIIDAITTKETLFFRDDFFFDALKQEIFPDLIKRLLAKSKEKSSLRIWSAGCSTGQELYSIAMTLSELNIEFLPIQLELLGTDIALSAVSKARQGAYSQFEIERGLSEERRNRFFNQTATGWQIRTSLFPHVKFEQLNLLHLPRYPVDMDLIFFRNVAIYFTPEDKLAILSNMAQSLKPDGLLFLGATENLQTFPEVFQEKKWGRLTCYSPQEVTEGP